MMSRIRLKPEEFADQLKKINPNVIQLQDYVVTREKISVKCVDCGYIWDALPMNLLHQQGCPRCYHKKSGIRQRLSHEEFINRIFSKNESTKVISTYITYESKMDCECLVCGHKWSRKAGALLQNPSCPQCKYNNGRSSRKSSDAFKKEVEEKFSDIEIIGIYTTSRDKILVRCKKCGNEWTPIANNLIRGGGCPKCNYSNGEREISKILSQNNIKFINQYRFFDCRDKYPLPFDFYLPDYNACIEYDGELHFLEAGFNGGKEKLKYTQKHDKIKTQYCLDNNIVLLRIKYTDYDVLEEIILEFLKGGDAVYGNQCNF